MITVRYTKKKLMCAQETQFSQSIAKWVII